MCYIQKTKKKRETKETADERETHNVYRQREQHNGSGVHRCYRERATAVILRSGGRFKTKLQDSAVLQYDQIYC